MSSTAALADELEDEWQEDEPSSQMRESFEAND
jgi:hypothetical protein